MLRRRPKQKQVELDHRRKKVADLYLTTKNIRMQEAADILGVKKAVIQEDLKWIAKEWQSERMASFEMQLAWQLSEYEDIKKECDDRLSKIKSAHQGSRWIEMRIKALDKQAKLLGLYAPDRHVVQGVETLDKTSRDAAVNAVIVTMQDNPVLRALFPEPVIEIPYQNDD